MTNPFKKHNCIPFHVHDLTNTHNLALFTKVVEAMKARSVNDCIVLDDVGFCLIQGAWSDTTGSFVAFRRHPCSSYENELVKNALVMFLEDVRKILTVNGKVAYNEIDWATGHFRVYSYTGTYSIGDLCNRRVTR